MKADNSLIIPDNYGSILDIAETENAIKTIKDYFQNSFSANLGLKRITAPLFVPAGSGLNDDLNGVEKPVSFSVPCADGLKVEIVQSLAKWKRVALAEYGFVYPEGIYTDMNAIRPDENLDNLHSIYVDQWDWERIILPEERNLDYLRDMVTRIYQSVKSTEDHICSLYPGFTPFLPPDIYFIHAEELLEMYPDRTPAEREYLITVREKAVFIIGIGCELSDGLRHDSRAPDYDDWISLNNEKGYRGFNGDLLVYYPVLDKAFELSSMGIRVDRESLAAQLKMRGEMHKLTLGFHKRLMNNQLPLTIGGGIGQSRLCMLFLRKAHIGEIQAGIWPDEMIRLCRENNIILL